MGQGQGGRKVLGPAAARGKRGRPGDLPSLPAGTHGCRRYAFRATKNSIPFIQGGTTQLPGNRGAVVVVTLDGEDPFTAGHAANTAILKRQPGSARVVVDRFDQDGMK